MYACVLTALTGGFVMRLLFAFRRIAMALAVALPPLAGWAIAGPVPPAAALQCWGAATPGLYGSAIYSNVFSNDTSACYAISGTGCIYADGSGIALGCANGSGTFQVTVSCLSGSHTYHSV